MSKTNQTIPNSWQIKSFDDCFDVAPKLDGLKKSEYQESGKYPVIDQSQSFISGFSDDGSILQDKVPAIIFGDHTRILKFIDFPFILGNDGIKVFWAKNNNDIKFLYYLLSNINIPNTGYNRHFKYLDQARILLPPKPEQEKIAEILSAVDEDIKKTEEVIRETERMKRGLMQELLTKGIGHTKFKKTKLGEIPEKWDAQPLNEVTREFIGGGTPSRSISRYWNGEIPWLTVKDFPQNFYVQGSSEYITEEGLKNSASNIVPKDSVITAIRVGLGRTFLNTIPLAINQDLRGVVPNKDIITSEFLTWFLISIGNQISADGSGSTVKGITLDKLKNYLIPIPDKAEQKEIVEILSGVDEKISVNKQLKEQLVQLKKGLMTDLLTGRVRVGSYE